MANADGSNQIRLTNDPAGDNSPAWSPKTNEIAFVSNRFGNADILLVNLNGNISTLTTNSAPDSAPAWSPDGSMIAFKTYTDTLSGAGCWRTRFGIESGSDQVLDFISKGITKEKIRNAITWAHEVGLRPKAFFMVGHMPDTPETIRETIEFAKSIPLHDVTVQINTLLPMTPQMEIWERECPCGSIHMVPED